MELMCAEAVGNLPAQAGSGSHSAALQAAIAAAQAHLQETKGTASPPTEPDAADPAEGGGAVPSLGRDSVAAGKSADTAAVAAAAASPSSAGPVLAERQPDMGQGAELPSDGAGGNLPSAGAAAAATASASVAAAVASDLG